MDAQEYEPTRQKVLKIQKNTRHPISTLPKVPQNRMSRVGRAAEGIRSSSNNASTSLSGKNLRPNNTEHLRYHQQRPKTVCGARRGPGSWG